MNWLKENRFNVGVLLATLIILIMNFVYQFFLNIVFQTVLSGTLVFVFGQIIQKFILEKIYNYKEVIARIDNRLKLYLKIIKNPGTEAHPIERLRVCSQELLQLSCDLESQRKQLILRTKQKDKEISQVSALLMNLHFGVFGKDTMSDKNLEDLKKIRKLLNIPTFEE